jgi:hypothetical protein
MKNRNIICAALLSALVCFPLLQTQAAGEGVALPNFNTANGDHALFHLTDGIANTAMGWYAQFALTDGSFNTAFGAGALDLNNSTENGGFGVAALLLNTTGARNNAVGSVALLNNDSGSFNNAHGGQALTTNVSGTQNNAFGDRALRDCTGSLNTAFGDDALILTTGSSNTGLGNNAGSTITTGGNNTCLGNAAGNGISTASNQVAIGVAATGPFADISNTCFIRSIYNQPVSNGASQQDVYVDSNNVLGFAVSSRRYKTDIHPMGKASEVVYGLKPVTFKYKTGGGTQYGLIAEDVAQVAPDLVFRDADGNVNTVRFEQISSLLLNEFLKEHKKVEEQQANISQLKSEMQTMVAQLKEQAAQIQKVSAQLEVSKAPPQVVVNKP